MKKKEILKLILVFIAAISASPVSANCITPTALQITGSNTVCSGTSISLSASASGTDVNTTYTWSGPSGAILANTAVLPSVTNGGLYTCIISNGVGCIDSVTTTITVINSVLPNITINTSANSVCSNVSLQFTSSILNGGNNPIYQWNRNGIPINGADSSMMNIPASNLATNDIITCTMLSDAVCAIPSTVISNSVVMTINQIPNLVVNPPGGFVCPGSPTLILTATGAASYLWSPATNLSSTTAAQVAASPGTNTIYTVTGTSNGCTKTVTVPVNYNASGAASLTINASQSSICAGSNVLFTAYPVGGGSAPQYQWKKNGININGATAYLFSSSTLNNNDVITCTMVSNDPCVSNANAVSNSVTMSVTASSTPSVNISANSTSICSGANVTFTAIPSFGGSNPSYFWKVNGVLVSNSGSIYSTTSLSNADTVRCTMISSQVCASPTTVQSNQVIMNVNVLSSPTITVTSSSSNICSGDLVTFNTSITNGGNTPSYQWRKNGVAISGATSATYSTSTLVNNDAITCELTSSSSCANPQVVLSNSISFTVTPTTNPVITIGSTAGTVVCANSVPSVMFLAQANNGGTNPQFQWYLNGQLQAGQTTTLFTPGAFNNGDSVRCQLTSNAVCIQQSVVNSNVLNMSVLANVNASLSISVDNSIICSGKEASFTAHPGANITNPIFQWRVNGVNVPQAIDTVFKSRDFLQGDNISALLFSSAECLSSNNVSSNTVQMTVNTSNFPMNFSADTQTPSADSFKVKLTNIINSPIDTAGKMFTWFFGDGSSYSGINPGVHFYPSNGTYSVGLVVKDTLSHCADTLTKLNYINCTGGLDCGQSISVTPSASTIAGCQGGNVVLECTTNALNATFQWNKDGAPIGGETQSKFIATSYGYYSVTVYTNGGCPKTSPYKLITFNAPAPPVPTISQSAELLACTPDTITLTASSGFTSYKWNDGSTSQSISIHQSGIYTVTGTVSEGCLRQSDPLAINASSVMAPPICIVTVDNTINKNILVWEKPISTEIDSFVVFKETEPNVYKRCGSQPYQSISEFVDFSSSPNTHSDVYKLAAVDHCGGLTLPSLFHRTVYLQINPGIGTSRVLSWNNQLGFPYNYVTVYRSTQPGVWDSIAQVSNQENMYVDFPPAVPLESVFYRIEVKLPPNSNGCTATKMNNAARVKSTSNSSTNKVMPIFNGIADNEGNSNPIVVYPNPASDEIIIEGYLPTHEIELYDLTGKLTMKFRVSNHTSKQTIHVEKLHAGFYFLKAGRFVSKISKN